MSEAFSASGSGKVPIGSSARNRGSTRPKSVNGFAVRDCTLLTLSTAVSAENAKEFHGALQLIPESSIYHHFWGRLMRTQFDEPEYSNDFAAWTYHHLRDKALAERLSAVDPAEFDSLGTLRQELIEIVEQALDENPMLSFIRAEQPLHFVQSEIIVLDSGIVYTTPREMADGMPGLSLGSVYYHFIDAHRRTSDRRDDLSIWLDSWGPEYARLVTALCNLDPYFSSLKEIRRMLVCAFGSFFDLPTEQWDPRGVMPETIPCPDEGRPR